MKQYIEVSQWNEITLEQKDKFWNGRAIHELPNIGQMIEFLGNDWPQGIIYTDGVWIKNVRNENLCDILWEEVKKKLG